MYKFFTHIILGAIEDNVNLFVFPTLINPWKETLIKLVGFPFGQYFNIYSDNQPVIWKTFYFLAQHMDSILLFNIIILSTIVITFLVTFITFNIFIKNKKISTVLSVSFLLSGYMTYQLGSHIDLAQIWLFVVFLALFIKRNFRFKYILLGLLLGLITSVSNYIGYFTILFVVFYFFSKQLVSWVVLKKNYWTSTTITNYIKLTIIFLITAGVLLTPYIKNNYTSGTTGIYTEGALTRPIEDFFTFTSRPWYYILPSTDNPFFGHHTKNALLWLQNDWGNFLATNYFVSEHSASYLGWINIILAIAGGAHLIKNLNKLRKPTPETLEILVLGAVGVCFFVLTMPPYIPILGVKLYMPSYLLWKYFSMFRVLTRLGIYILFFTLIYTGLGYKVLLEKTKGKTATMAKKIIYKTLIILAITVSFMELYVPPKIYDARRTPKVYTYIKEIVPLNAPIVIYPYSKTNLALFWLREYKRPLINPRSYSDSPNNFYAEEFTKKITTCEGLVEASELGAKYLVVFEQEISQEEIIRFNYFMGLGGLKIEAIFVEEPYKLREKVPPLFEDLIKIYSTDETDTAKLYSVKVNETNFKNNCKESEHQK